jgi:hypothetical protein
LTKELPVEERLTDSTHQSIFSSFFKTFQNHMGDQYLYIPRFWVAYDPYQNERQAWKQVS